MGQQHISAFLVVFSTLAATSLAEAQRRPSFMSDAAALARSRAALDLRSPADRDGRFFHTREVLLRRGDTVRFAVSSNDFDTLARATGPGGERWEDDDGAGRGTDSLLQFTAPRNGRYVLTVTSYAPGAIGAFRTEFSLLQRGALEHEGPTPIAAPRDTDRASGAASTALPARSSVVGSTYGIFVGISHYAGENRDLTGTAEDARRLARAFERTGWMNRHNAVVLTDGEATLGGVRQAFRALAPRVGPSDTLVFFFDGHGSAHSLDLRGEDLSRIELARLLDGVRGRSLVVLDSCESGGFAGVVRGHPYRAGLFSSRADENSSTAPEVGAGGWLAYNFRRAVEGGVRRRADGSIDFDDIVRFVERDYRARDLDQTLVATRGPENFSFGGVRPSPAYEPTGPVLSDGRNDPQYARAMPMGQLFPMLAPYKTDLPGTLFKGLTK